MARGAATSASFAKAQNEHNPDTTRALRSDREAEAATMRAWARPNGEGLTDQHQDEIEDGFGSRRNGEDRFDAVVGLLAMSPCLKADERQSSPHVRPLLRR